MGSVASERAPFVWSGRDDGDGPEHRRFWQTVSAPGRRADAALVGFASDEGVRRNGGQVGAAEGPAALRSALANLAVHEELTVVDHGDIVVESRESGIADLEAGQHRFGAAITAAREHAPLTVGLGGGHEIAYGSHLGLGRRPGLGVLNLDAHFDLRAAPRDSGTAVSTSGTPFRQIARDRLAAGLPFTYAVLGIARPSNTAALFETATTLGVRWLPDDLCQARDSALRFVETFVADVDEVYLSIDLDALPGSDAPGVSAPAALGVPPFVIQSVCDAVVDSGKLVHVDVAELNPRLDIDGRTARLAARLLHRAITGHAAREPS